MKDSRRSRQMPLLWVPGLAAFMAMASPEALANHAPETSAGSKDVLAEAGELFRAGQEHFEAFEFDDAIELWTRAHDLLPDDPEYRANRSFLTANLAQAHVEAHGVDGDVDHLRHADELYGEYLTLLDPADTQTRQTIEAERTRIEEILAREAPPEPAPEQDAEPEPSEPAEAPAEPATPESTPPERPVTNGIPPFTRWERRMSIAGGVNLIIGVALTGAAGTFFVLRNQIERDASRLARDPHHSVDDLRDRGKTVRRFDGLGWSTLVSAGVFGAVGIGLTAAGLDRRSRRLRGLARVVPSLSPTGPGAILTGRF